MPGKMRLCLRPLSLGSVPLRMKSRNFSPPPPMERFAHNGTQPKCFLGGVTSRGPNERACYGESDLD